MSLTVPLGEGVPSPEELRAPGKGRWSSSLMAPPGVSRSFLVAPLVIHTGLSKSVPMGGTLVGRP